ncbi:unnamed protein product, partial [Choristocarpus tenellus]
LTSQVQTLVSSAAWLCNRVLNPKSAGAEKGPKFLLGNMASAGCEGSLGGPISTAVKVAVRIRPLVGMEAAAGCQVCLHGDEENNQVVAGDNCFRFDHVFDSESTQEEVYRKTTLPLVERCLDGYNATVFAYGQTGSGKTWTVGNAYSVNGRPEDAGIIPRAV